MLAGFFEFLLLRLAQLPSSQLNLGHCSNSVPTASSNSQFLHSVRFSHCGPSYAL
jgi:hypothetical protein